MQQTTMLAIFAIALALGLTTAAMFAVPMMPKVFAEAGDNGNGCGQKIKHKTTHLPPYCAV